MSVKLWTEKLQVRLCDIRKKEIMGWYAFAKKEIKKKKYSGVIAALWLPAPAAKKLVLNRTDLAHNCEPETADSLHITLCYMGDSDTLSDKRNEITTLIKEWASSLDVNTLTGKISGIGRFHIPSGDAPEAIYASFDSPDLTHLRQSLVSHLHDGGVEIDKTHGFTPHITLAYLPKSTPTPDLRLDADEIKFDAITFAWGGEHTKCPLGSEK